ncbi:hypothetical protein, partial [Paenibacillus xylanexedens]|uniref:hypothetical protein n=1 Tax=Paenibacillus xylanexedens TaxID=528191 RepID=UPI001C92D95C
ERRLGGDHGVLSESESGMLLWGRGEEGGKVEGFVGEGGVGVGVIGGVEGSKVRIELKGR